MNKTEASTEIRIEYIKGADLCGKSGRIGITNLPPKNNLDNYFKHLNSEGIDIIVSLIVSFDDLGLFDFQKKAEEYELKSIWFPIEDFSIPEDREQFLKLVDLIVKTVDEGRTVLIHCVGGMGRSGTVAASCLIRMGVNPKEAIEITRRVRAGAIESQNQLNYLRNDFQK